MTTARISTWAPLRSQIFRALWIAQFVSYLGTWMQTVGAQWMLVDDPQAAVLVPLVQTATALPVMLLALPAGCWPISSTGGVCCSPPRARWPRSWVCWRY